MAFVMKRGDRRPYIPFQFFEPDGVTPLDVTGATVINIVVRLKGADPASAPVIKAPVTMSDAPNGIGEYRWAVGDTDTADNYEYEFEITWPNAEPQTIPQDSFFDLVIIADAG